MVNVEQDNFYMQMNTVVNPMQHYAASLRSEVTTITCMLSLLDRRTVVHVMITPRSLPKQQKYAWELAVILYR